MPDNARSALVVVDMQAFFFRQPERRQGLEGVVININRLIRHFQAWRLPVFHVITCYRADGSDWDLKMRAAGTPELVAGTPEAAILPQIEVAAAHPVLTKTRYSAFFKTDLAQRLREAEIHRVVVTGAYTHYCVNATVFDAYAHDFVPCIITDAVTSHLKDEAALMIERMRRNGYHVLSTAEYLGAANAWPSGSVGDISARIGYDVRDLKMAGYSDDEIFDVVYGARTLEDLLRRGPERARERADA